MCSFAGRSFDPPVRLAFDESQLREHLACTADAARSVYPEVADPLVQRPVSDLDDVPPGPLRVAGLTAPPDARQTTGRAAPSSGAIWRE